MSHDDSEFDFDVVRTNILNRSFATTYGEALKEWSYTGIVTEYEEPNEVCQLCGNTGLGSHFRIENIVTGRCLEIGSKCIQKYDVPVYGPDGQHLDSQDVQKRLLSDVDEVRRAHVREALAKLPERSAFFRDVYELKEAVPPLRLLQIFDALDKAKIPHRKSCFKVELRTKVARAELESLTERGFRSLSPALTSEQRRHWTRPQNPDAAKRESMKLWQAMQRRDKRKAEERLRQRS